MNVLLDECLPKALKQEFQNHNVFTVPEMGWAGKTNGELLDLAKNKFDVFISVDQNLQYQQNLTQTKIAVVLLKVKDNRYGTIKSLAPQVLRTLKTVQAGQLIFVKT